MKKGRHCLRLQANEEDVYRLMDTKERYFWMIGIGSLLEGIAAYFLYFRIKCWDLLYLCVILAFGIILLLRQAVKNQQKDYGSRSLLYGVGRIQSGGLPAGEKRTL